MKIQFSAASIALCAMLAVWLNDLFWNDSWKLLRRMDADVEFVERVFLQLSAHFHLMIKGAVNANQKMSIFAGMKCHFSPVSMGRVCSLDYPLLAGLKPVMCISDLTGENGKYNYSKAAHL